VLPPASQILLTQLFALGEVDLAVLGVSDAELASVGPSASSSSGGDPVLIVDDDGADCPNVEYPTIEAAATAASPGAAIKVCRGTYEEQVTIETDGLLLFSASAFQAVIKAPALMMEPKAIVHVNGARDITIRHFTITGPGGGRATRCATAFAWTAAARRRSPTTTSRRSATRRSAPARTASAC